MAAVASPISAARSPRRASSLPGTNVHALDAVGNRPRQPKPRPTKELSWELASHSKTYLEARQYAKGYDFLTSLLTAATSISVPAKPYVGYLAPAAQIGLASTLIAYPPVTTKSKTDNAIRGADAAVRYLRAVHDCIGGAAYQTIRKAFFFPDERTRRRAPGPRSGNASPSPGAGDDVERLAGVPAASAQSIWYRAEDFWQVVGWAFNCSVTHKRRWERWKLWLDVMLDFLEADWDTCKQAVLQDSLLWQYISSQDSTNRVTRRRIVKAVLATGSEQSLNQYPEVWDNETAQIMRRDREEKPIATVDFEKNELGDYGSDDEDVVMQDAPDSKEKPRTRRSSISSANSIILDTNDAVERLGGIEAVHLRQRLLTLLVQVAQELPSQFTNLEDLFNNYTEELIHLPTIIFSVLISTSQLPGIIQTALNANLLLPLTAGQLPDYTKCAPTQQHFEQYLLPLRGSTQSFAANAKISLILEQMFMYAMDQETLLTTTDSLRAAMETGIEARLKVYGTGKGKKGNAEEEEHGKSLLEASSERLLGLLEVLEIAAGKVPLQRKDQSKSLSLFSSSFGSELSSAPESDTEEDD